MVRPTVACPSDTSLSSEIDELTFDERRVQLFAKQMLQGRLFMGTFQEKRYVDSLGVYRDVVTISREEQNVIQDVLTVKQRVEELYSNEHWVGITTPETIGAPASYSLWVELPEGTTFGLYWFKIKRVKFDNNETCLRIKIIRSVNQDIQKAARETNEQNCNDAKDILKNIKGDVNDTLTYFLNNITTFANFKETLVFLFMLLATLSMSLFELLKCASEFSLKFMNEFSNFLKSAAPIFQILANLVDRLFKTLCMLILYLVKGSSARPQNVYPQRQYIPYQNLRALPAATKRRGVIIEEIE